MSRRLALLSAELATVRPLPHPHSADDDEDPPWWDEHTRIAPPRPPPAGPAPPRHPPPRQPPVVPVPGRHAARRRAPGPSLLPDTLRGRVLLGPAQLAVVAVVVSVGLAVTAWWVVLSDPDPVDDLAAPAGTPALLEPGTVLDPSASAGATPATPATVTVDVAGKVRRPGIAVLDSGARVVDALAAAGGVRAGVDVADLNLARVLVDGEQVLVGVPLPPGVAASAPPPSGGPPSVLVNLNTADLSQLDTLPEVGPVTADSIVAWREEHGGFSSVDELLEVDGIGEATLAKIAPHVTV